MNRAKAINRAMQRLRRAVSEVDYPLPEAFGICAYMAIGEYPLDVSIDVMRAHVGLTDPIQLNMSSSWGQVYRSYRAFELRMAGERRRRDESEKITWARRMYFTGLWKRDVQ